MRSKPFIYTLRIATLALFLSALFSRCASVMTPDGGPKDTIPPMIVAMNPDNFTTNFDSKKIYIEFDEFVKITDQQKEFFSSPKLKYRPTIATRSRGIMVTLRDTLRENTTYALNFGSSITDNNEGNPLHSMRYVFSTGESIDSMILSGYTEDSYKADSVSKSYIYMYVKDSIDIHADYDSTLLLREPSAIARAENNGIFLAHNLKPIDYYIYAFEDANNNQIYEPGSERVGFIDGAYNPANMPDFGIWLDTMRQYVVADPQLHIKMFTDKSFSRQLLSESKRERQHMATLYFGAENPSIEAIHFDSIPDEDIILEPLSYGGDTVAIWFASPSEMLRDTLRGNITYHKHDSLNILRPTTDKLTLTWRAIESREQEKERKDLERQRERAKRDGSEWIEPHQASSFKYKMDPESDGYINPEKGITFDFDYPLASHEIKAFSLIAIKSDTYEHIPLTFKVDSQNMRRWHLDGDWSRIEKSYELTIPKGAITNIAGEQNDSIVSSFQVMKPSEYSNLVIELKSSAIDKSHYIVQITNASGKIIEQQSGLRAGKVYFNYIPAGDIQIRIIQDVNHNSRWDSGSLVERRQPESSKIYSRNGETLFTTKVNWELEFTIDLEQLFAPESMDELIERLEQQERERVDKLLEEQYKKQAGENTSGGLGLGGNFNPTSVIN